MTSISQNLTRIEADSRIEWIQEHLGHRRDQSGHWNLVRYPYSNRVMLGFALISIVIGLMAVARF